MNKSASEPLLRTLSTDKQPIYNYIDSYQFYIQHCTRTGTHLVYHLVTFLPLRFCTLHAPVSANWYFIFAANRWA